MLALYVLDYYMKSLKVAKVLSEAVNRRTDNTSVNRTNNYLEHITQERSRNRNPTKNVSELGCHGTVSIFCSSGGHAQLDIFTQVECPL